MTIKILQNLYFFDRSIPKRGNSPTNKLNCCRCHILLIHTLNDSPICSTSDDLLSDVAPVWKFRAFVKKASIFPLKMTLFSVGSQLDLSLLHR